MQIAQTVSRGVQQGGRGLGLSAAAGVLRAPAAAVNGGRGWGGERGGGPAMHG
jgi:hypothetical protein